MKETKGFFDNHPEVDEFFITEDGYHFFKKGDAVNHSNQNKLNAPKRITRTAFNALQAFKENPSDENKAVVVEEIKGMVEADALQEHEQAANAQKAIAAALPGLDKSVKRAEKAAK